MKTELFPFQKRALSDLRTKTAEALGGYYRTHSPQIVSFTAPTGAGKTIVMASLIESIIYGDDKYPEQPDAIFVWLSDSPQLNEQSKIKIDTKADRIYLSQTVTVTEDSFDQETFDDGHIYFLNTQKLSKTSNLTKEGDRNYTIWETLANTAREKSDRLYVIIDEAHRGMQGREAGKATTIMQKFIKGSEADNLPPMPVVIGMSATPERFNKLVEDTTSTVYKSVVTPDEVRSSGLLKDRIIITYPEESSANKDMAVLQAAADDWKEKWEHWRQYCTEQHYAQVNPVFVIQVKNASNDKITATDLHDVLAAIEERTGYKFEKGQVAHTFGGDTGSLSINGLEIPYVEPSRIADDKNIRIVFFKENLSTGWDCPRAETMMSFRKAADSTYIAQLLGRMVRTPMQSHIQVDDVLNDVHLFLPYFDENTVKEVVAALQSNEGGDIPTEIFGQSIEHKRFETLTVKRTATNKKPISQSPGQLSLDLFSSGENSEVSSQREQQDTQHNQTSANCTDFPLETVDVEPETQQQPQYDSKSDDEKGQYKGVLDAEPREIDEKVQPDIFDREAVTKFINDLGILTFKVRSVAINNYLTSLYKMAHLLVQSEIYSDALREVNSDVLKMIRTYIETLKAQGKYQEYASKVKQFKLSAQIFDVFGKTVDNYAVHNLFTATETNIDRQFRQANNKLSEEGIGNEYGRTYFDDNDPNAYKIDVILFAADSEEMTKLHNYAKDKFHYFNDEYRKYIAKLDSEKIRKQYGDIVSDGDIVSKHNFRLPETIQCTQEAEGNEYSTHLYVNDDTGTAKLKLNSWEKGVIAEEEKRDDFVCWIRNPARSSWGLCIPYEINNEIRPTYPDFIIVRKDPKLNYVIDILEPHRPNEKDNIGKARGFAEYARQTPEIGRLQLIRKEKDITGKERFKRLDLTKGAVRDKVSKATTNDELDHIFDTDGFFE